jgi:SAM-dependent methyltransferase
MKRTEIINLLIQNIDAKKYLEIGISDGTNFSNIKCDHKIGVDPSTETSANFHLTSDEFFEKNEETFDVIFVDGLHHADQVYRDVMNSLQVLNEGGYIICHDLNPVEEQHQIIPYQGGAWNGDCWKAFVMLRMERDDLEMYTVDSDCGCGIITRGSQELLNLSYPMTYHYLDQNRKELLNLISPEEFLSKFVDNSQYDLSQLLHNYVNDPENPEHNFALGIYYDGIGQTASALSYYLRCAERSDDDLLKYECLILAAMCFDKQGTRNFTVKSLLLHTLALCPHRPEGYYLMSRFHEKENKDGSWNESYTIASIGLKVADLNPPPLRTTVDYPGEYALQFRKALASWNCGLCEESRDLFLELLDKYEMIPSFRQIAIDNLKNMNVDTNTKPFAVYTKNKFDNLKVKFDGAENIQENYSEAYQDMFVLTMLNGKRNGTYLEVGAGNAFYGNNTALLEKEFDWKGVALDIDEGFVAAHTNERSNPCLLKDATKINYVPFLNGLDFPNDIDYLQLDCDPPEVTYKILLSIPFDTHKFAVITYEHDYYCDETKSFQEKSRKYLESYGYIRVVNNISPDDNRPYEDWWVHPDLVNGDILNQMLDISDETKKAEKYILNK